MTTPPFSGNDFRDQIDSVARNLTGDAFRLKQNDPDAPLKFMDFVAQSENEFMQVKQQLPLGGFQVPPPPPQPTGFDVQPQAAIPTQPTSELDILRAQAERRIADPQEQIAPFQFGQIQETPPRGVGADFLPFLGIAEPFGLIGEQVGRSVARDVFDAGPGVTNLAGLGGAVLADPGSLASLARGGLAAGRTTGRAVRQIPDVAANVGAAAERAGLPSPVSVARAAEDVPSAGRRRTIDELRAAGGEPDFSIQVNAPGTFGDIAPREVNASNVADIRRRLEALIDPQGRGLPHQGRVIATKIEREGFESLSRTERDIAQDVIVRNLEPGERLTAAELRTGAERIINEAQESLVALDDAVANAEADVIQRGIDRIGANEPLSPATTARTADDVPPRLPEQAVQPQVADDAARLTPEQQLEADVAAVREQRRVPQTAEDIAQDTVIRPSGGISASEQLFGLSGEIDTGLTRRERAVNRIRQQLDPSKIDEIQGFRRTLGAETDPVIEPLFKERARVIANAEKRASSVVARVMPRIKRTFDIADNGTIDSLRGIDPALPVAPTLQDVAARLPRFLNRLTPEQRGIMEELRVFAEPYGRALRESGDDFGTRTDIMEGGFYLPRGNAANADLAIGFSRGSRRAGANISQEQSATFGSMAEGIANGWEYDAIGDAIGGLVRRSGQRVADNFTQRFLREAKNEDGQRFGLTIKELLVRDNPAIAAKFSDLTKAATRLKTLLKNKDSQAIRGLERLLADPDFDDVAEVRRVFLNSRNVLRGELKGQNVKQVRESLKALQKELAEFRTVYDKAKKSAARNAGRRQIGGAESFPQLNGVTFPERMAARANEALQQEGADLGRLSRGLAGFDAFQRIWRAANATLDNSGVGIQGLLGAAENPIRGSKVLRRNLEAGLGTKSAEVYSDWATDFNTRVGSQGRLSTDDWAGQFGLAQLGKSPDVQSGILESIPGAGRVFARADRAFAIVGDMTRAEWADDLLREELLAGKTIDQMRADGTLQQIANTVNAATGFVDGNFNLANLAMFSARFFTARILTMLRAIRGMDIDAPLDLVPYAGKNLQRKLPKVNKFSRTQDKYARRAMMRLIGYGTMLTVLANASQGRDTDFRPVVNGRPNPNFARFRAFNRDWSVFGPWDSMLRMVMNLGTGNFRDTSDSLLNAPMIAATLDLRDNERFGGEPIINQKGDFGEKSGQILQYFGEAALPFAGAEAGELIPEAQEQLTEQDWAGLGITGLTAISEGFGIKSSPLSMSELRELANNPLIDASTRAEINQEIRERQERFRKFDSPSQGQSTADRIFGGDGR